MTTSAIAQQQAPNGPWADEVIIDSSDPAIGVERLISGEIDWWHDSIGLPALFKRIQQAGLPYSVSYGLYYEITVNYACKMDEATGEIIEPVFPNPSKLPDPTVQGKILFNPFCSRKIREALHYIINREFIATQILGGLATPRYTALAPSFPDYGRLYDVIMNIEQRYKYDFDKGKSIIFEEMMKLGAKLVEGKWYYKGQPVILIVLIRIEDARRDIGDYLASQLEQLGFTVLRYYGDGRKLSQLWRRDPYDGTMHLYTAGWITTEVARDEAANFGFFYTKLGQPDLIWQRIVNTPEFFDVASKLYYNNYATLAERRELMVKALELSMSVENQRIFITHRVAVWPRQKYVTISSDLASGYSGSWLWAWTIGKINPDTGQRLVGGSLKASMGNIFVDPWNPVGGSNWIYDQTILRAMGEPAVIADPYSGLYWPHRVKKAEVYAESGLPITKTLDWVELKFVNKNEVPTDAWYVYDCKSGKILTVGEARNNMDVVKAYMPDIEEVSTTSLVKVKVYYDESLFKGTYKWHDGSPFDLSDIIYTFIMTFDRACSGSKLYDESYLATFQNWFGMFRGFKIISEDPLVIEYYTDTWYMDAEWSAAGAANAFWPVYSYGVGPWHAVEMVAKAERDGRLAFTDTKASILDVEWADLTKGPSLPIIAEYLEKSIQEKWIPYKEILSKYLSEAEVSARYSNLKSWYSTYGHYYVGNGPFYLYRVDPVAKSVVLRAYRNHIDKADKYAFLAAPPSPTLMLEVPPKVIPGDRADISIRVLTPTGELYQNEYVDFIRYILIYPGGSITGETAPVARGLYKVTLSEEQTASLPAGPMQLRIIAVSKLVGIPTVKDTYITVAPITEYIAEALGKIRVELLSEIDTLKGELNSLKTTLVPQVSALRNEVESLRTITYISAIVAIVAVIVAIVALVKKPK
ncbi:MAG: ABC transporter substrate-binding protein [Desulfurococcaceae archaeon]